MAESPKHHEFNTEEIVGIPEAVVVQQFLRAVGREIGNAIPPNYGFMLMVFEYSDPTKAEEKEQGNLFYISSATRDTMLKALGEFIERNSDGAGN